MLEPQAPQAVAVEAPEYHWYHKLWALLFIVFCVDVGTFLMVFPWTDSWERNLFSVLVPEWHGYWANSYVRGAVSGLGVANIYISLIEIFRLRRFARR